MTPLALLGCAAGFLALALILLYAGKGLLAWVLPSALALILLHRSGTLPAAALRPGAFALVALALLFGLPPLRRLIVTPFAMRAVAPLLPHMGETERVALDAGTVWWDADLFSGDPDWERMLSEPVPALSGKEKAFLAGPVEELCRMLDDWRVTQERDLSPEVWAFLKKQKFWGMIIPESYGGLGFSALAHSAVVTRLSGRCVTAAVTVMVPNSLGPAELLLHYGTEEQKRHYLPRLANGEEIPCFALTEPGAGSDAASIRSEGTVCRGNFEGREVLGIRLDWDKRYCTLGPVATVIGLAFRLHDPEKLLGGREEPGITCALVPAKLPGIRIGERHDPLGIPFHNGPLSGTDVFVPVDFIIGGAPMAGQGWRMLMDCLAAGRSISLPSLSTGAAELAARTASAYGMVRKQFDMAIGRFEGVEAPLARIGGMAYLMNAARVVTAGAVDRGQKPSVVSAIVKAYCTEGMRTVLNDAMDIQAGAGISRGPRNILGRAYAAVPIGITVEGANILTRSMIIFGQGAIRCHPYARKEMDAVAARDLAAFDAAFFGHVGFVFQSAARSLILGLTGGSLARPEAGPLSDACARITRMSSAYALCAEAAMATLGGQLKRRELLSGRLADALAWMYLGAATIKHFEDEGRNPKDLPYARWATRHAAFQTQEALIGLLDNLPNRPVACLLRQLAFPLGETLRPPTDEEGAEVARSLVGDLEARDRITADLFRPGPEDPSLGRLEAAFRKVTAAAEPQRKLREAVKAKRIEAGPAATLAERAALAGILTPEERATLEDAEAARRDAIQVDAFPQDVFRTLHG